MFLDAFGKIMKCKGMIICSKIIIQNNRVEGVVGKHLLGTQLGEDVVV